MRQPFVYTEVWALSVLFTLTLELYQQQALWFRRGFITIMRQAVELKGFIPPSKPEKDAALIPEACMCPPVFWSFLFPTFQSTLLP